MNKCGICFSTRDRTELSSRTIEPLLQTAKFDLFIVDGSATGEGKEWALSRSDRPHVGYIGNIRGGADAAIVHNLTYLLDEGYEYIGLVENDVLLTSPDWFDRTMELFDAGACDGLAVGAVSARCYVDRIMAQQDGYALMHNLGAGMVIFTRQAAQLVLEHFRTTWTVENRIVFAQLAGIDIGRYWAFKGGEHWLCADWGFDKTLAAHGYASLALTPSPVEMIGQDPPLAGQGLVLADQEIEEFRKPEVFACFVDRLAAVIEGCDVLSSGSRYVDSQGELVFAHQFLSLTESAWSGEWNIKWFQGFGPFAWSASKGATLAIPILGPCHVLIRGGPSGGQFKIVDQYSNYEVTPTLQPDIMMAAYVPGTIQNRVIHLQALDPGMIVHGVQCVHPQMRLTGHPFDWHQLPKV